MSDLELFTYSGYDVRTVVIDGEVWFVAADVAAVLEYRMASDMTRRLDDDDKGYAEVRTPGGDQNMSVISEAGLYDAIFRSNSDGAKPFRRWITGEVIPAIRRTGSYSNAPALSGPELLAHAVLEAKAMLDEAHATIAVLEPKAEVADRFLEAEGDYSVRDAAQSLTRAGIKVGERRLFSVLATKGWIKRAVGDGRYRVIQSAIEAGYMSVLPQSHYHPRTGILVIDPPQPRVTPKGLQRLLLDSGVEE
jgi:anti-repressor protein